MHEGLEFGAREWGAAEHAREWMLRQGKGMKVVFEFWTERLSQCQHGGRISIQSDGANGTACAAVDRHQMALLNGIVSYALRFSRG